MYRAYDDQGTIAEGRARECFQEIVNWLESEEAEKVYKEDDLLSMIGVFNSERNIGIAVDKKSFEFEGFTVEHIQDEKDLKCK